eukprot:NODE_54_length_26799_cov_0.554794.p13 type:complete len:106 gc:universal NODE_54_length_26799_cov_0.554794:14185-13868(-)
MTTLWPSLTFLTCLPILSTTPQASWPTISYGRISFISFVYRCKSLPQIVDFVTLTIASVGSVIKGFSTFTSRMSSVPNQAKASIFSLAAVLLLVEVEVSTGSDLL